MNPWELCCHNIFRATDTTWLWNIKRSHLSTSPSLPPFFLLLNTPLFLCQEKGMSCKANDLVWLKTPENKQVTQESHWVMGNKPCHWNVSRMKQAHCVLMWQYWAAPKPGLKENIFQKHTSDVQKIKMQTTACIIIMLLVEKWNTVDTIIVNKFLYI